MSAEPPVAPAAAHRPGRGGWLAWALLALLALIALLAAGVAWLLGTAPGARFALDRAVRMAGEGVRMEGVEGRLGGLLRIKRIEVSRPDLYAAIDDLELDTSPLEPLRGTLLVNRLTARAIEVRTASTGATARIPERFAPPYRVRLEEGRIAELRTGTLSREAQAERDPARRRALMHATRAADFVVRDIFVKGAGDRSAYRIDEARAETPLGSGKVRGRLANGAPYDLDAKAELQGEAASRAWRADVTARGTLKAFVATVDGRISGQPIEGSASIEPFAAMPLRALEARAVDVDLSQQAQGPRTRLGIDVKLAAASPGVFAGPVRVDNAEPGPWDAQRLPFSSASARVVVTQERAEVAELAVALAGGGSARGHATLRSTGIDANLMLAQVDLASLHRELQKTRISGRFTVSGDRAAQRFDVALRDPRFQVEGRAVLAAQQLTMDRVRVATGGGAVNASGRLALAGRKDFRFEGRAEHFDPSAFVKTARGDLNFAFVTSGTLAGGVAGEARVEIAPSTYAGLATTGRVNVAGDARRIASADVDLALGEARLAAKGSFGRAGDAMAFSFRTPNLASVGKAFGVALAGRAQGEGVLTGTFQSPAGRIALTGAELVLPSNVHIGELALRAEAGLDPQSAIDAQVQVKTLASGGKGEAPTVVAQAATLTVKGTRAVHRLTLDATMTPQTSASAVLAGGLDPRSRAPAWSGRIESFGFTGRGAFTLQAPATLHAAADRVEVGEARLKGEWGEASLGVTRWTPRTLELSGSTAGLQIQNVARSLRLGSVPRSNLVIAGDWRVNSAETFNATIDLHRVSGDLRLGEPPLPLGLQELSLKAEVVRGRARARATLLGERVGRLEGTGSALIVRGRSGWELAPDAPVEARVVAEHTNLEALSPWLGADAKLGGRLNALLTVSGTGSDPRLAGEARAVDLVVREPQTGFEVEQGEVVLRMAGKSVVIERFNALTPWRPVAAARENFQDLALPPHGTISAEGSIDLGGRRGTLRVKADKAVVTQLPTRFLAVSGEAQLRAEGEGLLASGAFKADAGWVGALETPLPTVSEDVVVVRAARPAAQEAPRPGEKIRIDLKVSLGDRVYFEGRGLDTRLAGDLQITGAPGSSLRANGRIRTVGGTYKGYGQNLSIERGVLQFSGAIDNPQLNVLAVRKGLAVEPGVEVLGTATRPRVRLVSTPDVPEPEKLSWLVLGRGPSELAPGDASVLLAAATSMLGRNNPGTDLGKRLGLDEVRIGRADSGSILGVLPQSTVAGKTGSASAAEVVSVGKRITRDVHLSYEQGLADAEGALKVAWQITRQFQLLVRAGYLPGLDAVYRWTFK